MTSRFLSSGLGLALSDPVTPAQVKRLVVAHDLAKVEWVLELLTVDEEGHVVGLEGREHSGNVRDMDIAHFKLNLQWNN